MFKLFLQDARRWIDQGQINAHAQLSFGALLLLLYRYLPLRAMAWFRFGSWCTHKGIPFLPSFVQHQIYSRYGLEIVVGANIGGGLYIAHPVGTVIAVNRMGAN